MVEENDSLKAQVAHLQGKLREAEAEQAALVTERTELGVQVGRLDREKRGTQ